MSHPKQRGKGRMAPGRGPRGGYNKFASSQNALPHNSSMVDDYDNMCNIYGNPYLTHVAMSLLGCTVQVCVKNGIIYEGIFRAVSPKMEVTLELAHIVGKKGQVDEDLSNIPNKNSICDSLLFATKDIISITAKNIDLEYAHKKDAFVVDQQISRSFNNGQVNERELEPWKPHTDCTEGETEWLGDGNTRVKNGWDVQEMFQTNKEKYGVKSSFNSEMHAYTIPLEKSTDKDYIEKERQAARIAHEIEHSKGHIEREELDSGRTEEELFSAVVRRNGAAGDNKYIPPALRQGGTRGDRQRETDISQQPKEQTVTNNVTDGSPKPQRVLPAKPSDDHRPISKIASNEPISRHSTSPVLQAELVSKADKLQIAATNASPQSVATVSAFTTAATTGITTVTSTVAPGSSGSTVTVTATAVIVTATSTCANPPTQAAPPSEQLVTGERDGEKKTVEEIEALKDFHSNFNLDPNARKQKEYKERATQKLTETEKDATATNGAKDTESKETAQEERQNTSDPPSSSAAESILVTSKLNPNAREFRFNPNAKEFKPHVQQRHTPPMPSGQHYAMQPQVPISPGPGYSPSFSMQPAYPGSMYAVLGPHQIGQPPTGPGFRTQTAKPFTMQPRPYGPRDQPGDPGMAGHRVISAAAAAGSPIIAPGTPQQLPMMPQGTTIYGVPVPQQVIPQQSPGINYVPVLSGPGTPSHFMAPHSTGMSSSVMPGTPSYTYSFSQDVAPMQMYVTGNVAAVPGSPSVQGQPHPSPSQQMNQFVFQVPSPVPSPQQVAPPQGGPVTGHPASAQQIIYVNQHAPPVGAVSAAQLQQQQPQYTGYRQRRQYSREEVDLNRQRRYRVLSQSKEDTDRSKRPPFALQSIEEVDQHREQNQNSPVQDKSQPEEIEHEVHKMPTIQMPRQKPTEELEKYQVEPPQIAMPEHRNGESKKGETMKSIEL